MKKLELFNEIIIFLFLDQMNKKHFENKSRNPTMAYNLFHKILRKPSITNSNVEISYDSYKVVQYPFITTIFAISIPVQYNLTITVNALHENSLFVLLDEPSFYLSTKTAL